MRGPRSSELNGHLPYAPEIILLPEHTLLSHHGAPEAWQRGSISGRVNCKKTYLEKARRCGGCVRSGVVSRGSPGSGALRRREVVGAVVEKDAGSCVRGLPAALRPAPGRLEILEGGVEVARDPEASARDAPGVRGVLVGRRCAAIVENAERGLGCRLIRANTLTQSACEALPPVVSTTM